MWCMDGIALIIHARGITGISLSDHIFLNSIDDLLSFFCIISVIIDTK